MNTIKARRVGKWDHWLILSVMALVLMGLILALDTSYPTLFHSIRMSNGRERLTGDEYAYLIRFVGAVLVGVAAVCGVMTMNIQTIRRLAPWFFYGSDTR
ncbi:MAG: hypothetical protein M1330_02485, partial [Armatimonadetes bacterium]|nr:hypothetical protein [Armatimonadota bacterium]